jgi:hypothetical protein
LGHSSTASDTYVLINLPDLVVEQLAFIASYESDELGGPHLHVRCGDRVIWRELDTPDPPNLGRLRYFEELLRRTYGRRFGGLTFAADANSFIDGRPLSSRGSRRGTSDWMWGSG